MLHNQPFFTASTHTLMYHGLNYAVPNLRPVNPLEFIEHVLGKRLAYCGVRYESNSAMIRESLATQIRKPLLYRNVAYMVNVVKKTRHH
jgi:hypothetical protein